MLNNLLGKHYALIVLISINLNFFAPTKANAEEYDTAQLIVRMAKYLLAEGACTELTGNCMTYAADMYKYYLEKWNALPPQTKAALGGSFAIWLLRALPFIVIAGEIIWASVLLIQLWEAGEDYEEAEREGRRLDELLEVWRSEKKLGDNGGFICSGSPKDHPNYDPRFQGKYVCNPNNGQWKIGSSENESCEDEGILNQWMCLPGLICKKNPGQTTATCNQSVRR